MCVRTLCCAVLRCAVWAARHTSVFVGTACLIGLAAGWCSAVLLNAPVGWAAAKAAGTVQHTHAELCCAVGPHLLVGLAGGCWCWCWSCLLWAHGCADGGYGRWWHTGALSCESASYLQQQAAAGGCPVRRVCSSNACKDAVSCISMYDNLLLNVVCTQCSVQPSRQHVGCVWHLQHPTYYAFN
jgi:hypothetical protein